MKMQPKDALHILGLTTKATLEEIKTAYRRACAKYHPDSNPAGLEMMKLVNSAYESLENYIPTNEDEEGTSANYGEAVNAALSAIITFGLHIEMCGSWVWVSGDTRQYKEELKGAGFKWAPKKAMWHFRPPEWKSANRGTWDIEKIRERHGSEVIRGKSRPQLEASA